jgi:hypothetical protein
MCYEDRGFYGTAVWTLYYRQDLIYPMDVFKGGPYIFLVGYSVLETPLAYVAHFCIFERCLDLNGRVLP